MLCGRQSWLFVCFYAQLLPVTLFVTGNGFSDSDILYDVKIFLSALIFRLIGRFPLLMRSFDHISTSGINNLTSYLNSVDPFSYKDAVISGPDTVFEDL